MKKLALLLIIYSFSACKIYFKKINNHAVYHLATVNNVCKKLKDEIVLYAIFVDSKYTGYWTQFDIESTLDSIQKAIDWIEKQNPVDVKNIVKNIFPLSIIFIFVFR